MSAAAYTIHVSRVLLVVSTLSYTVYATAGVTLYGILDEGVSWANNVGGASQTGLRSGVASASRLGFVGDEALGRGWSTVFRLENGYDVSSGKLGQNGRMFGRQAYVGLRGPEVTITLGRQYDAMSEYLGPVLSTARGPAPFYDIDNTGSDYRTNNAIKVTSATFRGFSAGVLYAPGGVAGAAGRNTTISVGVGYQSGNVRAALAYTSVNSPYASWYDSTGAASNAIYGRYLPSTQRLELVGGGVAYQTGALTLHGGITHAGLIGTTYGSAEFNVYVASADYWVTPRFQVSAAADGLFGSRTSAVDPVRMLQYNLSVDYLISKQTDVYLWAVYGHATNAHAQVNFLGVSNNRDQINFHLGLRHRF
ncbi:porin [Burkholderia multivorans]|nr:porin [Burkholderia multivorans]